MVDSLGSVIFDDSGKSCDRSFPCRSNGFHILVVRSRSMIDFELVLTVERRNFEIMEPNLVAAAQA